ncbi:DUF3526 domain-containing protein [Gynurincola endophyticus]|uniref:DUF3526 domain-containing protein n=1 Tax=Gynurincola endophyticus TaxID=2479004 RepID=UPI000F8C5A7E|nr:DUF3526 domain-containing protein [Gynurincola endophyticus]
MKHLITIMQNEFRHFARSTFKIISLFLFIVAAIYGLQNGYTLLKKQKEEIESIKNKNKLTINEVTVWYDAGKKGPDDKPWIDVTTPVRAIWYAPAVAFKEPSELIPFSIGQAEQYGYYKQVTNRSSTMDADLAEEIANPERLMTGTLDFSFAILYLLPVLSIILLFNIGGLEKDLSFNKLIEINNINNKKWLLARFGFYFFLLISLIILLMFTYALLTGALTELAGNFIRFCMLIVFYTALWFGAFYFINLKGKGSAGQAIKMVSLWIILCIVIPGTVHQLVTLKYPASYMTDFLDASREETYKIYDLPSDNIAQQLLTIYPQLAHTQHGKDTLKNELIIGNSTSGITNQLMKNAVKKIENINENKNNFIRNSYFFNPVSWFQNKMNSLSETDYDAYYRYRQTIQQMIDQKVEIQLMDSWNKVKVDKERFLRYVDTFSNINKK